MLDMLPYRFLFKKPIGTSRGILRERLGWLIVQKEGGQIRDYVGEICLIPGLSLDDPHKIEPLLKEILRDFPNGKTPDLQAFPGVRFAIETARIAESGSAPSLLFDNDFTAKKKDLPINGLIWMGNVNTMWSQIVRKVETGFRCIKCKIGGLDFLMEFDFLLKFRHEFAHKDLQLRLDANGAFSPQNALSKLEQLSVLDIHSIEQPIPKGNLEALRTLCEDSPIPIALDEELIGIHTSKEKAKLLDFVQPQYLVLKPSLLGGFISCEEWVLLAEERKIGWWITSALESSVGLNAIAQWTANLVFHGKGLSFRPRSLTFAQDYHGLGTGDIYSNNLPPCLRMKGSSLSFWRSRPLK